MQNSLRQLADTPENAEYAYVTHECATHASTHIRKGAAILGRRLCGDARVRGPLGSGAARAVSMRVSGLRVAMRRKREMLRIAPPSRGAHSRCPPKAMP